MLLVLLKYAFIEVKVLVACLSFVVHRSSLNPCKMPEMKIELLSQYWSLRMIH